jgi:hypothetical protein
MGTALTDAADFESNMNCTARRKHRYLEFCLPNADIDMQMYTSPQVGFPWCMESLLAQVGEDYFYASSSQFCKNMIGMPLRLRKCAPSGRGDGSSKFLQLLCYGKIPGML